MGRRIFTVAVALLAAAALVGSARDVERPASAFGASRSFSVQSPNTSYVSKPVLGAAAVVFEEESGLAFAARIDTGAKSCSIHADDLRVAGGSQRMEDNVGKVVRFRIANRDGESMWLERPIAEVAFVQSADSAEWRYKVPMTLRCEGTEKRVLISLNDRSQMGYAMLVCRNFLAGEFLVDVGTDE